MKSHRMNFYVAFTIGHLNTVPINQSKYIAQTIQVTKPDERGWLISPVANVPVWAMFAGILPALLLFVLLFMETSICQLIMLDKTKGKKGVGVHLDIVILSGLNCLSSKLTFVSEF